MVRTADRIEAIRAGDVAASLGNQEVVQEVWDDYSENWPDDPSAQAELRKDLMTAKDQR